MFTLTKVQEFRRIPNTHEVRLVAERPYVRLVQQEELSVFLQDGRFYFEDGSIVSPVPEWVLDAAKKINKEKLIKVGFADGVLVAQPEEPVQILNDETGDGEPGEGKPKEPTSVQDLLDEIEREKLGKDED